MFGQYNLSKLEPHTWRIVHSIRVVQFIFLWMWNPPYKELLQRLTPSIWFSGIVLRSKEQYNEIETKHSFTANPENHKKNMCWREFILSSLFQIFFPTLLNSRLIQKCIHNQQLFWKQKNNRKIRRNLKVYSRKITFWND